MTERRGENNSNKEIDNKVKTILVEDKGEKEGVPRATEDQKMRGEVDGLRVLREIDQNIVIT